jgi:hypothetical protein
MLFRSRTTEHTVLGLSTVVFLLVGHFSYYVSPDLTLIKASWNWFSLRGFSRGSLPENIGVLCVIFDFLFYAYVACLVDYSIVLLVDKVILF